MKTKKGNIRAGKYKKYMQVVLHKIEADNSMTLQQGEGCVLSILLAESPLGKSLANGAVQNAENVTLCKAESDNIVTDTEGGEGGEGEGKSN